MLTDIHSRCWHSQTFTAAIWRFLPAIGLLFNSSWLIQNTFLPFSCSGTAPFLLIRLSLRACFSAHPSLAFSLSSSLVSTNMQVFSTATISYLQSSIFLTWFPLSSPKHPWFNSNYAVLTPLDCLHYFLKLILLANLSFFVCFHSCYLSKQSHILSLPLSPTSRLLTFHSFAVACFCPDAPPTAWWCPGQDSSYPKLSLLLSSRLHSMVPSLSVACAWSPWVTFFPLKPTPKSPTDFHASFPSEYIQPHPGSPCC